MARECRNVQFRSSGFGREVEELTQRHGLVLRDIVSTTDRLPVGQAELDGAHHIFTIYMAKWKAGIVGHQQRAAIPHAKQIILQTVEVVALAVHHGKTQRRNWKRVFRVRLHEEVFGSPLLDPIDPVVVIEVVVFGRLRHHRAFIVFFAERALRTFPNEIDLTGADKDVVAYSAAQHVYSDGCVATVVQSGINRGIKVATKKALAVPSFGTVAVKHLDLARQFVQRAAAMEDRYLVSVLQ